MKKLLSILMSLFISMSFVTPCVQAADTNVEISFKIGDSTLKVNGEDLTVETPYVVDGVTLVPLRVITESFGAEVTWHEETQEIDVDYEGVNMKLAIGSKDVYTNGIKSELLAAPELKNGVTMLPLRFITENFGADVSYDEQTKAVLVTKDYVESNSIKDYASILKHSEKEYLGDSYYGWSMKRTSKMKLQSRSFDGRKTYFEGENLITSLSISNIGEEDEVTLDSLLNDVRTLSQGMSVTKLQKSTSVSGLEFVQAQLKDSDSFLDIRQFIKDGKVFSLLTTLLSSDQKEFEEINSTLDTFDMTFDANTAEDLSDVDAGTGMHTFKSDDLGLEISIPAEYVNITNGSSLNSFYFVAPPLEYGDSRGVNIFMYSSSDDQNAKFWAETDLKHNSMSVNPDYFTYSDLMETTIDGRTAYYYTADVNINNVKNTSRDIFIDDGDYFYNISIEVSNDDKGIELMNTIQNSIKLSGADAEKMGTLIRTDDISDIAYKEYKYDAYDITFNLPDTFELQQEVNSASGYDTKSSMMFSVTSINGSSIAQGSSVSLKELVDMARQSMQENKNILNVSEIETKKIDGETVYTIEYDNKDAEGLMMHIREYYVESNKVFHVFAILSDTIYSGENIKNAISEFEKTLKFN